MGEASRGGGRGDGDDGSVNLTKNVIEEQKQISRSGDKQVKNTNA